MKTSRSEYLIVTGSHPDVLNEIMDIPVVWQADFLAVGLDAVNKYHFPIRYMATYHPSDIVPARERRKKYGGNTDYEVISHQQHQGEVHLIIPFEPPTGSSSLLGTLAGLKMGYRKIILCGCPLQGANDQNHSYEIYRDGWRAQYDKIRDYVRSMSGWTRELLGAPTEEWLNG